MINYYINFVLTLELLNLKWGGRVFSRDVRSAENIYKKDRFKTRFAKLIICRKQILKEIRRWFQCNNILKQLEISY